MKRLLLFLLMVPLLLFSQDDSFTDERDGKTYKTVKIGEQVWMAENLAYKPSSGYYWAYDDDNSNVEKYGYLYDWETACKVCPAGWHLPSDNEWTILTDYLGEEVAGTKMKSTSGWRDIGNGTNESGFNGFPSGSRDYDGSFVGIGIHVGWWSSSEHSAGNAWDRNACIRVLYDDNGMVGSYSSNEIIGFSVRCLRD